MSQKRTLSMDVKVGESLSLDGGRIVLRVEQKSGQVARIRFTMDQDVSLSKAVANMAAVARRGVQ